MTKLNTFQKLDMVVELSRKCFLNRTEDIYTVKLPLSTVTKMAVKSLP